MCKLTQLKVDLAVLQRSGADSAMVIAFAIAALDSILEGNKPPIDLLHEVFVFHDIGGYMAWKHDDPRGRWKAGDQAGTDIGEYRELRFKRDAVKYRVMEHHAVWAMEHGCYPKRLDHVDLNKQNNRLSNLREATPQQNSFNRRRAKNNKSGIPGVRQRKNGRWEAYIQVNGKTIRSLHDNVRQAAAARRRMLKKYAGEFARAA